MHTRLCSWCHHSNTIDHGWPAFCSACGHRADLSRMSCNCKKCRCQQRDFLTADDVKAVREWLAKRGTPIT